MKRTLKDWILATRPWSFPASSISIVAMGAYFYYRAALAGNGWHAYEWILVVLAFLMMVAFQAGGNLFSDYYDHQRKVDLPGSLNGVRHIQSGLFTPVQIKRYGIALLSAAIALGLIILLIVACHANQNATATCTACALIGLAGVALAFCYPWLKYHAWGDLDILLCYALLPSMGLYLLLRHTATASPLLVCLPFGLLTVAILHANNTRDIQNDHRAGIRTMPQLMGRRTSQYLYVAEVAAAYVLVIVWVVTRLVPPAALITFLTLPMAVRNIRTMLKAGTDFEHDIATLDKDSAQLQLVFGLLYTLAFVLTTLFV